MWWSIFSSPRTSVASLQFSLMFLNQLWRGSPGRVLVSCQHSHHCETTSHSLSLSLSASLTLMYKSISLLKKETAELAHYEAAITNDPLPLFWVAASKKNKQKDFCSLFLNRLLCIWLHWNNFLFPITVLCFRKKLFMVNSENIIQILYPTEVADIGIKSKHQLPGSVQRKSKDKSGPVLLVNRLLTLQTQKQRLKTFWNVCWVRITWVNCQ